MFKRCARLVVLWEISKQSMGVLLLLGGLLSGCEQKAPVEMNTGGTGESFGGADELTAALEDLRTRVLEVQWTSIPAAPVNESFCDFQAICNNQTNPLCAAAPVLSAAEIQTCDSFIRSVAPAALGAVGNSQIEVEVVTEPLLVNGNQVTARTELSGTGKIWFSLPRVNLLKLSLDGLSALLTHEFLHKTAVNSGYLADNAVVGNFGAGKGAGALFTAVGYALALRHVFKKDFDLNGDFPALALYTDGMKSISTSTIQPSIPHSQGINPPQDFAWSFIVQINTLQTDTATDRNILFVKGNEATPYWPYACEYINQTAWWGNDGKVECGIRDNQSLFPFTVRSNAKINDGRTHFLVFSRKGNTLRLFIDGRLDVERTYAFPFQPTVNNDPLQIANRNLKNRFRGKIGFVHLWKNDLTLAQVQALGEALTDFVSDLLDLISGILGGR